MAVAIPTLLQPAVVNARVDRLRLVNTTMQSHFGMQKGGGAVRQSPMGRRGSFDVFNSTRKLAKPTAPGTPAAMIAPNPVGNVNYIIPRFHPSMHLLAEFLHNQRPIGGPVGQIDTSGQQYVADQETILKQLITNVREFQVAAMCRGSYTMAVDTPINGFTLAYSGGTITVNYQIPSGNLTKLDMLGAGDILATSWDNAAAPIVTDCLQVNAGFIVLTGRGLKDVMLTSTGWGYIGANTQVQTQAGTANTYFDFITRDEASNNFTARIRALPWLTFTVNDNGLDTGSGAESLVTGVDIGRFAKFIEDDHAVFMIEQDNVVAQYWECGEPISEFTGQPVVHRVGEYYWVAPTSNPTGYQLFALLNGLPILQVPAGIAYGLIKY